MTAALTTLTEVPAPVLGHHVQEIDGKPQHFQSDDDKPAPSGAPLATFGSDPTPAAGHELILTEDSSRYVVTGALELLKPPETSTVKPKIYTGPVTHGPELTATDEDRARSAQLTTRLWDHLARAGGPRPATQAHHHVPHAFPAQWLAALELPSRTRIPEGQAVTLTGPGFTRHPDHAAMLADYTTNPRTWVFESAHRHIPWLNHAARRLTETTASRYPVLAAVYDSRAEDHPSTPHTDAWYSAIIQIDGAKHWTIGPDRQHVTTQPGDILFIPEGLAHTVATPANPGHSRHLVFDLAIHTALTTTP